MTLIRLRNIMFCKSWMHSCNTDSTSRGEFGALDGKNISAPHTGLFNPYFSPPHSPSHRHSTINTTLTRGRPCISSSSSSSSISSSVGNSNNQVAHGHSWWDGCRKCFCNHGYEMCELVVCPPVRCSNPIVLSDSCCPTCPVCISSVNGVMHSSHCFPTVSNSRQSNRLTVDGSLKGYPVQLVPGSIGPPEIFNIASLEFILHGILLMRC
ncbi:hypothetical protein HELRODRAFT_161144 [Helobdella robusta]|uniref:VWFC domain-containing protein n=1 Tax=Helobdella robusta TaxID=6412 RepID=T1ER52_HELRO|nr:hypothetical protein HELRODRAFT_161144 [Helobdella robusta]ESO01938.1 hypothetical protein HELRODRAFT_161144 [Helobdella robusta]